MKKLVTLLAAAGLVAAAAAPASAVDVKVDYRHRISIKSGTDDFTGTNLEEMKNRVRLGLTMAASENLKAYVQFQLLHNHQLGDIAGTHGDNDTTVRQMYMDWKIPGTAAKVRMGRQEMGLPVDAFGSNSVMDPGYGSRDGIVVTSPVTDWLSLTALWSRANYQPYAYTVTKDSKTTVSTAHDLDKNHSDDIYAAVANLKFDGVSASVYAAYATLDAGMTSNADGDGLTAYKKFANGSTLPNFEGDAYWIGFTSTWTFFDPFTFKLSAAFGEAAADEDGVKGQKGWNIQAKASYKTAYGTPVLGAWYFSGDEKDELGTMPSVQGAFNPTKWYNDGAKGLNGGLGKENPMGHWGAQIGVENVSFLKDLSHTFLISYLEGTNDVDPDDAGAYYLTTEDSLVAFDLINTYQIYKNLAMHLQLNYIISDFETKTLDEDGYGAEITFEYRF